MIDLQTDPSIGRLGSGTSSHLERTARRIQRIQLVMSDTGGGHRACAHALSQAMLEIDPGLDVGMMDGFQESGAFPLPLMPKLYTSWSENRNLWRAAFFLTNGRRISNAVFYPLQKKTSQGLCETLMENEPDVVVVLHPCLTKATYKAVEGMANRPRIVTVVTDLVYGHASWFASGADHYFVPTDEMRELAIRRGVDEKLLTVTGLPLAPRLFKLRKRKERLRGELGFERPTVICVGGADGMGIQRMIPALTQLPESVNSHVICGKNEGLKRRLEDSDLPGNIHVHGFVSHLPEMLAAADVALIKASPTVLMESVAVGTYVLLYDYVPGQEYPNVRFVKENGLGDYSRSPSMIAEKINARLSARNRVAGSVQSNYIPPDGARVIANQLLGEDSF